MGSMTIRDIDEELEARLRLQAETHGHSVEEEARDILRAALSAAPAKAGTLIEAIRARVEPLGGVELELPARDVGRNPPNFRT